jgi:hypothetical protein
MHAPAHRRALLFFHHILSQKKRSFIRASARDLRVSGICKVGHPGVLVVQGDERAVAAYVRGIKACHIIPALHLLRTAALTFAQALRWQSCALNASDPLPPAELADFGDDMCELEDMKALGARMRDAPPGWYDWWTHAMGFAGPGRPPAQ